MGLLHRRGPRYVRPWPFAGLLAAGLLVAIHGLGASFQASLQTGNVFLLVTLPVAQGAAQAAAVAEACVGVSLVLAAFGVGTQGKRATERQLRDGAPAWRSAAFRVYPATFLLGLFLLYFGLVFLFDASVYGDDVPGGLAAFIYLDYAGLLSRPLVTLVGFAVSLLGFTLATRLSWEAGLGQRRVGGEPPPVAAVAVTSASS